MGEDSITLKVAEALQDEVGYGRGRLDTVTRNELGLSIGDIVEIHGRRRDPTVAIVWRARTEDEGKGIIRVDGLIRNNAKVNLGDKVEVKKAQIKPAQKEDEEHRVWYVGVTRTLQNLYILTAKKEAKGYDIESLG